MRRASLLPAVLLAILPGLFLYAHNAAQLHPRQLLQPLLIAAGLAIALTGLLAIWLRRWSTAALLAGILCFLAQASGAATQGWMAVGLALPVARWLALVTLLVLLTVAVVLVLRLHRRPTRLQGLHRRILWLSLLFVLVQLGRIAWVEGRSRPSTPLPVSPVAAFDDEAAGDGFPDIYFILLDGYGRSDVLQDIYGFDNRDFVQTLQSLGFQVGSRSRANYVGTLWALASILNLDYLQQVSEIDADLKQMNPLIRLVRNNRVVHELRGLGYEIIVLSSGYGVAEFGKPDLYLEVANGLDDFEQMLVDMTVVSLWGGSSSNAHARHRARLQWAFDSLGNEPRSDKPRFVFAHILAPHPPFVFDAQGEPLAAGGRFALNDGSDYYALGHTRAEYVQGYSQQVRWVTDQVLRSIQRLLQRSTRPPVVVLMSDHGPGSGLDWLSLRDSDLRERYGILQALLLPETPGLQLADDLSPVSTFRLIFDLYFGHNLGPLPARSYFCTKDRPFDFQDITDRLTVSP